MSTTLYSESDVDVGKLLGSNDEDGLVDLVSEESTVGLVGTGKGVGDGRIFVRSGPVLPILICIQLFPISMQSIH